MLTTRFKRNKKGIVTHVNGRKLTERDVLSKLRIPPAWTEVQVEDDGGAAMVARGFDEADRPQMLYSPEHVAAAKAGKFERVRTLLSEWEDIRTQIEEDVNDKEFVGKDREAALVAYLIYETGIRPGSNTDTGAEEWAYGASTLELRHVKPAAKGVRLKFVGKKGVDQSVLVTNPYLVRLMKKRKSATTSWSETLFDVSSSKVNQYIKLLGSGQFTAKDFRTARGTSVALEILSERVRWPKTKSGRRKIVNDALDKVAKKLGNTRAIARSSYVDPSVLEKFVPEEN